MRMNIFWTSCRMNTRMSISVIKPDWPAAQSIHAFCTTRNLAENSLAETTGTFDHFNLALHVEDNAQTVIANRRQLVEQLALPSEPVWLNQVHGQRVVNAARFADSHADLLIDADATFTDRPDHICTVMTADCLPVLICNRKGTKVAAAHAGWRGLVDGIIENTVASLNEGPQRLLVWLGPAIGPAAFEVGEDVRDAFITALPASAKAFQPNRSGHFLADIYQLARLRLKAMGIEAVYGGEYCTFTDVNRFYSYRRDGKTGRQASLIWFE